MIVVTREWFMGRAERERWLLAAMLAIALPLLLYLLIYAPMSRALEAAKDRHVAAVEQNGRVKAQLLQLREGAATTTSAPPIGDLALLVGESAGRSGIALATTEARGTGVAVSLSATSTTAAFRWLRELEAQGAVVTDLKVTPVPGGSFAVTAQFSRRDNP